MTIRRTAVASVSLAVAAVALAGCTKPAPGVSVFSGTTSEYREAVCWAFDAPALDPTQCAEDVLAKGTTGDGVAQIPVLPGDVIGISVDTAVADEGWYPVIGGQRLTNEPLTTTYYRFDYPNGQQVPSDGVPLQVIAGKEEMRGVWAFKLVPAAG